MIDNFSEKAKSILTALGFKINDKFTITAPIWRGPDDMTIPEDITEEVARIWGYEEIDSIPSKVPLVNQRFDGEVEMMRVIEETLVQKCNLTQVETYPRISEKMANEFNSGSDFLELQNPVNPNCPILRPTFLPQFLQIAAKNAKFFDSFGIFDTGKLWIDDDEQLSTGILLYNKSINSRAEDTLLELKGILNIVFSSLNIYGEIEYKITKLDYFHPKKQGEILINNKKVGQIGSIHPSILKSNKLPENANVCFVEFCLKNLENINIKQDTKTWKYETEQDQILWRDLSFLVDEKSDFSSLLSSISSLPEVQDLEVFDIYQGENVPVGKKSISLKIKIIGDGTMTSEAIGEIMDKAIKTAQKSGGELRG
ncbi:hypothetical protein AGMMS50249_0960 [candidate division SR1 bacterium]|nr:hypothetical protein AGMMS50249_0960 [candidate division SR1 bacterium]